MTPFVRDLEAFRATPRRQTHHSDSEHKQDEQQHGTVRSIPLPQRKHAACQVLTVEKANLSAVCGDGRNVVKQSCYVVLTVSWFTRETACR